MGVESRLIRTIGYEAFKSADGGEVEREDLSERRVRSGGRQRTGLVGFRGERTGMEIPKKGGKNENLVEKNEGKAINSQTQ